tara:strand:- start:445 stop:1371 length:927 start_codon:yes stop_codon:yes gene_type:complete
MSNEITLLPEYIDFVQEPSVEFYKTATNLMDAFTTYTGQLSVAIDFEKTKVSNDVILSTAKLYATLNNDNFKVSVDDTSYEFDNIFKLFYIEKFQTLTDNLKNLITATFSGSNVYFTKYSDDIGNITNITSIVDSSTSPYFDIEDIVFAYPNSIAASLYNKISRNELRTSINLTTLTDAVLKTSMQGLQTGVNQQTAKTSHSENLITDNLYIERVFKYSDTINSKLQNILGDMADFISYFKEVNYRDQDDKRKVPFLTYTSQVEGTGVIIDILKNKLDKSPPTTLTSTQSGEEVSRSTTPFTVETTLS